MRALGLKSASFLAALCLAGCAMTDTTAPVASVAIPEDLLARHDFSLADTPNKRTALAYLYSAWNDGNLAQARAKYWVPGTVFAAPPGPPPGGAGGPPPIAMGPGGSPQYTVKKVIEEGDQVVVLALVEGVGIGTEITTIFGTSGGTKIGDAVVEIMRFDKNGLIAEKWDTIEPVSERGYDFK